MEFKGTPAPWNYNENFGGTVSGSNRTMVACCYPRDEEMKANARLIAAAPELLEVLIQMLSELEIWFDNDKEYPDSLIMAKKVIAKALSQQ